LSAERLEAAADSKREAAEGKTAWELWCHYCVACLGPAALFLLVEYYLLNGAAKYPGFLGVGEFVGGLGGLNWAPWFLGAHSFCWGCTWIHASVVFGSTFMYVVSVAFVLPIHLIDAFVLKDVRFSVTCVFASVALVVLGRLLVLVSKWQKGSASPAFTYLAPAEPGGGAEVQKGSTTTVCTPRVQDADGCMA
jgi:hypothetical protein